VVRVNSPGGSALASDIMWKAARRLGKKKPLVVSMGGVAASGGYYVSVPAEHIFAEASTITGSIGVVGGKPVWSELMEDHLGITTTEYSRGKNAALYSMNRDWTEQEMAKIESFMNEVYGQFKDRIRTGRGERIKGDLDGMAGGRVYTGQQALELGLIDEIGGLSDAIKYAGRKVGLRDPEVYTLPKPKDFSQILATLFGEETKDEFEMTRGQISGASLNLLGSARRPRSATCCRCCTRSRPELSRRAIQDLTQLMILQNERIGVIAPHIPMVR
jgi:protease-4